ncbi:MAG: alanine--tRNA ligase, partial [Heliobacteriaceae bacterium]|nr:alanine--tRNA ligase [Heliobacteriaceae bacterium]
KNTIKKEEERFKLTLDRGYKMLEEFTADISGEDAFKLYDTYGFPFELTKEIAEERGLKVDEQGFKLAMRKQKERAKAAAAKISLTDDLKYVAIENEFGSTNFTGYHSTCENAKIIAAVEGNGYTDIVLDKTPFYAESGGQVGDTGILEGENLKAEVLTTFKVNKLFVHRANVINGEVIIGDSVKARIDEARRAQIRLHHSAAHLLQAALIKVLGDEVRQAGSQVKENRTRFDFSFSRAMTSREIADVEAIMNNWIWEGLDICTVEMAIEEAKRTGAIALFGEKYDEVVRVVTMGSISKELCAGTHAQNTGYMGLAKIISESAIAAGTRRIELAVSKAAYEVLNKLIENEKRRVTELDGKYKDTQKEIAHVREQSARREFAKMSVKANDFDIGKLLITRVNEGDLKIGAEALAKKLGESIIVLASKTSVTARVSDGFVKKGFNAGQIVSEISKATGANGGGRPNFAQGGVKDAAKLDEVLEKVENDIKNRTVTA